MGNTTRNHISRLKFCLEQIVFSKHIWKAIFYQKQIINIPVIFAMKLYAYDSYLMENKFDEAYYYKD